MGLDHVLTSFRCRYEKIVFPAERTVAGWRGTFEDALIRIGLIAVAIGARVMLCSFSLD